MKTSNLIFLIIILISYSQNGLAIKNWEILLVTKNHIGYSDNKAISYKDKKLRFNEMQIDRILLPNALQNINKIKIHKAKKGYCHEGEYFLKIDKVVKASGCIENANYAALNESFDKLKYLALVSAN